MFKRPKTNKKAEPDLDPSSVQACLLSLLGCPLDFGEGQSVKELKLSVHVTSQRTVGVHKNTQTQNCGENKNVGKICCVNDALNLWHFYYVYIFKSVLTFFIAILFYFIFSFLMYFNCFL